MPDFRRGLSENEPRSKGSKGGGAFCRDIIWTEDKEEKFIVFLNPASYMIDKISLHEFVPVGEGTSRSGKKYVKYEKFIDRRDPAIGEDSDDLTDRLGHTARIRSIAVAAELEPTYKMVNGRKRPTGFAVKTETFTRKDENGEEEEVEAPIIGVIAQGKKNFYGWVRSFNAATAPIEEVPLQVVRSGKDSDTVYNFTPFLDQKIDFTNLIQNIENVAYLRGELDDINLDGDPAEVAAAIGVKMLDKRLEEWADKERYEELVGPITHIEDRFSAKPKAAVSAKQPSFDEIVPPASSRDSKFEALRKQYEQVS